MRLAGRLVAALIVAAAGLMVARAAAHGGAAALIAPIAAVRSLGRLAPLAYIGAYAVAVALFVPASILTLAGGAMFGFWRALVFALAGAYLGQTISFLVARYIARHAIEQWLAGMPRLRALDRAVRADARRIVFLLRLSPVMPFPVLNYALGATGVHLSDFSIGSAGMLPGAILYSYAGALAGQALALAGRAAPPRTTSYYVMAGAGFVATVAATALVARIARTALRGGDLGDPL
ncbi:MAG: TVP38/TMEM64 family protein [Betaproteobacteria bacterium]